MNFTLKHKDGSTLIIDLSTGERLVVDRSPTYAPQWCLWLRRPLGLHEWGRWDPRTGDVAWEAIHDPEVNDHEEMRTLSKTLSEGLWRFVDSGEQLVWWRVPEWEVL